MQRRVHARKTDRDGLAQILLGISQGLGVPRKGKQVTEFIPFKRFDRELSDFRDAVAKASMTMGEATARYLAMLESLDTAFLLYWDDMPANDKAKMMAAFDKLAGTVSVVKEEIESPSNVVPIKS